MQYLFVIICFLGCTAGMVFIKSLGLGTGLTTALAVPQVLLVIFSIAKLAIRLENGPFYNV